MANYKLSEVLECLQDYSNQGFEFVEIRELADNDSEPDTLFVSAINKDETVEEIIDAVELPF